MSGASMIRAVVMPERAISINTAVRVIDTGDDLIEGPRLPVYVLQPMDLAEYGGAFRLTGAKPMPMRLATQGRILGGPCIPVYPVLEDGKYDADWGGSHG
jgi:hypothetical protein